MRFGTISFLSDFGLRDEFVGVVKSVMAQLAPDVRILDVTHDIPAHDVRSGSLALARSAQYLCPGVVLGVVDPGVGTDRRRVAIEVGDGASYLVGPDNGLFAPAVALVGGATAAYELDNTDYHQPAPGVTFDGRDVFGPIAAHICVGVPLDELGTQIDVGSLQPGVLPVSTVEDDGVHGSVLWIDTYGNVQLNIDPDEIGTFGEHLRVSWDGGGRAVKRVPNYASVPTGAIGLVVDSYGMLSLVVDRSSAAIELRLSEGDSVKLATAEEPTASGEPVSSPVSLSPRPNR